MNLKNLYLKYQIPPNLQQHMMSVAGIAKIISDNWNTNDLDKKTLLNACLIHDMGNLLKFDLVNKVNFLGEEAKNVEHWRMVKEEMVKKYGPDEHNATASICKELGLSEKPLWIVENWGFGNFKKVLESDNWEYKIGVYCDHRIGPFGIVSLIDRFAEQRKRYEQQKHDSADILAHISDKSEMLANCAFEVEKQLQTKTQKNLSEITDHEIKALFGYFFEMEIMTGSDG